MNKLKSIGCLLVLLAATPVLQAQQTMTLQQAREMALAQSEDLKSAEAKLAGAMATQKAARSNYLPDVSISATGLYLFDHIQSEYYLPTFKPNASTGKLEPNVVTDASGNPVVGADGIPVFAQYAYLPVDLTLHGAYLAGVSVEQPLFVGGKIASGNRMAGIGVEMATENRQLQRVNAVVEADKAYWLYVSVQSKVKLAQKSCAMLQAILKRVQNSFDVGLVKKNDVLKVQVEYDRARLDWQKARSGLELTRMALCRVTGLSFDTPLVTDTALVVDHPIEPVPGQADVTLRPEYRLLSKSVELEENRVKTVRSDYLPTIGVRGGYNYFGRVDLNDKELNSGSFSVLAHIKIPLFHWGEGQQKVISAQTEKSIRELERQKNIQLMQLEIENARLNLADAWLRITMSESALDQATENLRVSKDNFEVGRELLTDLLVAQTQWAKASSELLDAKTSYKLSETEYQRVTASLFPAGENQK